MIFAPCVFLMRVNRFVSPLDRVFANVTSRVTSLGNLSICASHGKVGLGTGIFLIKGSGSQYERFQIFPVLCFVIKKKGQISGIPGMNKN